MIALSVFVLIGGHVTGGEHREFVTQHWRVHLWEQCASSAAGTLYAMWV